MPPAMEQARGGSQEEQAAEGERLASVAERAVRAQHDCEAREDARRQVVCFVCMQIYIHTYICIDIYLYVCMYIHL